MIPLQFSCTDDLFTTSNRPSIIFNIHGVFLSATHHRRRRYLMFLRYTSSRLIPIHVLDERRSAALYLHLHLAVCVYFGGEREISGQLRYTKTSFVSSHLSIHDATIYRRRAGNKDEQACVALHYQYTIATEATFSFGSTR